MTREAFNQINLNRIARGQQPLTFTESPGRRLPLRIETAASLLADKRERETKKKTTRLDALNTIRISDPIKLTLPYPPSANRYWRSIVIGGSVRVLVSSEAREYKRRCAAIAAVACPSPLEGPLGMSLAVFRPMRRGDLSNRIKVIEDAMQGVVFHDDNQVIRIDAQRHDDKTNPRVEVVVWQITEANQSASQY